jgi:hypothetical protein
VKDDPKLNNDVEPTESAGFDPNNPKTWPFLCNMREVAMVLRYKHHRTARKLTTKPPEEGGLAFVLRGKTRFVHRDDLAAFVGRRQTASPKYQSPSRNKPKITPSTPSSGGMIARLVAQRNKAA